MTQTEVQQMTLSERLEAMEALWQSLVDDAESLPSPDWHSEVLRGRLDRYRRGKTKFHTVDEVRQSLLGAA